MPSLKSVIDSFNSGFCYLDPSTNARKTRWFEFWMACSTLKEECTNTQLTKDLEGVARSTNQRLEALSQANGANDFLTAQQDFKNIIAYAIHQAQIKRFKNGELTTDCTVADDGSSYSTRTIVPKSAGYFEKMVVMGLEAVAKLDPELNSLMTAMIDTINNSKSSSVLVFEATTRGQGKLRMFSDRNLTTMESNYHLGSEREKYALEHIASLRL